MIVVLLIIYIEGENAGKKKPANILLAGHS